MYMDLILEILILLLLSPYAVNEITRTRTYKSCYTFLWTLVYIFLFHLRGNCWLNTRFHRMIVTMDFVSEGLRWERKERHVLAREYISRRIILVVALQVAALITAWIMDLMTLYEIFLRETYPETWLGVLYDPSIHVFRAKVYRSRVRCMYSSHRPQCRFHAGRNRQRQVGHCTN